MDETKERPPLKWELILTTFGTLPMHRAKVPGGWLITMLSEAPAITFYPDPDHRWDGGSLP